MVLKPGDKAPLFSLRASDTSEVHLTDFEGKNLVILFFPLAFTSVCTTELCTMRDSLSLYQDLNASIVAISVDSPFTLAKFKEDNKLNFPLLSDFNKETSRDYGALYEDFVLGLKGVSKRAAFVVDASGIVKYAEVLESAGDLPNFKAIETSLNEI